MRIQTRQVTAGTVLAVVLGAAGALAQPLGTLDAGDGLYLQQIGLRAAVREPSGLVTELSLPPGTALRRIEPLTGGWVAAGEVDHAGLSELFLLRSSDRVRSSFAAPPKGAGEPYRAGPLPLIDRGRLTGLAWLAGAGVRQTAVWAASWSRFGWSQPELVSPVGPGTQIAIDGVVLADGSWLLVWAAHDGEDDEILWSRRRAGSWSEPALLHEPNEAPDVKPAIVATSRGALAAWNSYDGRAYRVRLAVYAAGAWRQLGPIDAGGAVRPRLTPHESGALLLYRTVAPPTWTVLQLDERGASRRIAVLEEENPFPPGLVPRGDAAPRLEWPGERTEEPLRRETEWRAEP